MLDINYIRANRQKVEDAIKNKGYEIDLAEILDLDDEEAEAMMAEEGIEITEGDEDDGTVDLGEEF